MGVAAAGASSAMSVLGAGASALGDLQQGDYQAQVAHNNAMIAAGNVNNAYGAGAAQEQQAGLATRAQVGGIRAAQAANGLNVNQGSAVQVQSSAAGLGQLNALTIRNNAARAAYGYQVQENSFKDSAVNDTIAGQEGALGAVIGGLSQASGQISSLARTGAYQTALSPTAS